MKSIKLTQKILDSLKPSTILYAEYATDGAMGCAGTARIFTLEKSKLNFYLIDDIFNNEANAKIYSEVNAFLDNLQKSGKLDTAYAGFGNYAYKSPKVSFTRDDDSFSLIYKKSSKTYLIPVSTPGVYNHIVATFASREVTIEALEEYFKKSHQHFSDSEYFFYKQYLDQIKRNDSGQSWFDFTVIDYLNAVAWLQHLSGESYILNWQERLDCESALNKYRLKYVVVNLGWNKLNHIFAQLVKTKSTKLFAKIEEELHEKIDNIYNTLETIKSNCTSTEVLDPNNLEHLFNRPILVDFPKSAHTAIIKDIVNRSGSSFNPDAKSIAYYLANYLLNEDKLSYSDILPAVAHIIETMPDDDFNQTHTEDLFWVCGEIIDHAWRYITENDTTQKKYRDLVYELYWPRIGSLWPVLNFERFEFKHESATKIFKDSLSFVMALEDIDERNPEIKAFLKVNAENVNYKAGPLGRRSFVYTLKGLKPKQEFEKILKGIEPDDYCTYLTYPNGIEEAEILLDELFRTDEKARITNTARLACFEALILTPNTIGVGEYILNYIDRHFNQFTEIISTEAIKLNQEPENVLTDMFIAISKGITEENEFPPLKSIKRKLLNIGCDEEILQNSEKYARHHRRTILFQRSALQKHF